MSTIFKRALIIIGSFTCLIVLLLNVFSISVINPAESSTLSLYNIKDLALNLIVIFLVLFLNRIYYKKFSNIKKSTKVFVIILVLIIYVLLQIYWINIRGATPNHDQMWVYNDAVNI